VKNADEDRKFYQKQVLRLRDYDEIENNNKKLMIQVKELLNCLDLIDATKGMNNAKTRYYLEAQTLLTEIKNDQQ
jgi:hypothetical protein